MQSIHDVLKSYWGFSSFRPLQEDIINAVLDGKDVLALLPTGGGKSICFQVPAMVKEGLCIVISPLIALMKDQVENLRKKGITAFAIYAGMTRKDVVNTLKLATAENTRFLYVSPERLETKLFLEYLPALSVSMITVDEAHCISQWGYDFRPPYLRIAALRDELPGVPVLALTASATPEVQKDICEKLKFNNHSVFRQSFERPNISYSVFKTDAKITRVVDILNKVPGTSIIYCKSRKRTREMAEQLNSYNIQADYYHAGLTNDQRNEKQEAWIKNQVRTIVATNAFGMGIDKPDVRTVIHIDPPDNLENYYQEAGRAGRDTNKAYAVLLFQERDITTLREQVELRFPPVEEIRKVYQSIMNYLQLPEGTGEGNYYDFDLADFIEKFKFPVHLVINSMKALEQENVLSFNEQVYLPSKVGFVCSKEILYEFERSQPTYEPLIKTLLRTYEGIFDQPVNINEKFIARRLNFEVTDVVMMLNKLTAFLIIEYQPQKDKPQVFFVTNRVKTELLRIDSVRWERLKENYKKRIEAFTAYIMSGDCRSRMIGNYFGDDVMKNCDVCDNCLKAKKKAITKEEFLSIETKLLDLLKNKPIHSRELAAVISGIKKEKAWQVIEFLQAEKKIVVNAEGMICINK
jgi:ATP-dependent DNA helicase RecQ